MLVAESLVVREPNFQSFQPGSALPLISLKKEKKQQLRCEFQNKTKQQLV